MRPALFISPRPQLRSTTPTIIRQSRTYTVWCIVCATLLDAGGQPSATEREKEIKQLTDPCRSQERALWPRLPPQMYSILHVLRNSTMIGQFNEKGSTLLFHKWVGYCLGKFVELTSGAGGGVSGVLVGKWSRSGGGKRSWNEQQQVQLGVKRSKMLTSFWRYIIFPHLTQWVFDF
jgi:hypothetical protein